jgi:pyrroloquinoline quinone (PQQ) biosynthesis protein C
MTEVARTHAHQHLLDARLREADLIAGVVHAYVVETQHLPFVDRSDTERRKAFVTAYFAHLVGIERAFVIAQTTLKINDVLWKMERARLEAADA